MELTKLFCINGQPMPAPDCDPEISYADLDSADSGRDESGIMHRQVVRRRVATWPFVYAHLSDADYRYLCGLLDNAGDTFAFTHPARGNSAVTETSDCYCSKYSIVFHDARRGLWRNFKFNIIEC